MAVIVYKITDFFLHYPSEMHCKVHILPRVNAVLASQCYSMISQSV